MYCGPKIAGFELNVAEKNDARAAIRVSPVIFFTTTKVVRMKATKMNAENPCQQNEQFGVHADIHPTEYSDCAKYDWEARRVNVIPDVTSGGVGSFGLKTLVCLNVFC